MGTNREWITCVPLAPSFNCYNRPLPQFPPQPAHPLPAHLPSTTKSQYMRLRREVRRQGREVRAGLLCERPVPLWSSSQPLPPPHSIGLLVWHNQETRVAHENDLTSGHSRMALHKIIYFGTNNSTKYSILLSTLHVHIFLLAQYKSHCSRAQCLLAQVRYRGYDSNTSKGFRLTTTLNFPTRILTNFNTF